MKRGYINTIAKVTEKDFFKIEAKFTYSKQTYKFPRI